MADLYHLLDELQEREEEDERRDIHHHDEDDEEEGVFLEQDDTPTTKREKTSNDSNNRRLTVETAVTADMSYDNDDWNDGDYNDNRARPVVPEALRRHDNDDEHEGNGRGGGIDDLLEEEEFDKVIIVDETVTGKKIGKTKNSTSSRGGSKFLLRDEQEEMVLQDAHTLGEMYGTLHRQWLEEQHSPELLRINTDLIEEIKSKIEMKQDQLDDKMSQVPMTGEGNTHAVHLLMADVEQQDLDRAKFVLADYLMMRLQKIEAYALYYYKERSSISKPSYASSKTIHRDRMSPMEVKYLEQYWALEKQLLETTVTDQMPSDLDRWKKVDSRKMVEEPDTTGYHFWVVQDEPLVLGDEIHESHSCIIAKYSKMKDFLEDGKVRLLM